MKRTQIIRNIFALVIGIVAGSLINMGIIILGNTIVSPPLGVNSNDMLSIKNAMPQYEAKHFIVPFLAHAIGTLIGAYLAARIAATKNLVFAVVIGIWFLIGGIAAAYMLGTPVIPTAIDLIFAYIPMCFLGYKAASNSINK